MSRSTSTFDIITHTINAAHLREYPQGTTSGYLNVPRLKLSVNQYIPRSNHNRVRKPTDITIVFAHANGFHRELYEPFFEELLTRLEKRGYVVRSIWAPDAAHQGMSGVINEEYLGDDPCWNDFSRDIMHMINVFQEEMATPIIGIGHSFGGHAITRLALMHQGLFAAVVLVEPVVEAKEEVEKHHYGAGLSPPQASAKRVDQWPSYEDAVGYFRSRGFYKLWDPRVVDLHLQFGLRPLPTMTYPDGKGVTLTTTKHQEVMTFQRVARAGIDESLGRIEPGVTRELMHRIKAPGIFIVGATSLFSKDNLNQRKREAWPQAEMVIMEKVGHLIPQEKPALLADHAAEFLGRKLKTWYEEAQRDAKKARPKVLTPIALDALAKKKAML